MAKPPLPSIGLLLLLPLTAACSTAVDHPSLAPRAVERFTVAEPTPPPSPPPAALPEDASRQERAAALAALAREADGRFRQRLTEVQGIVASGSAAAPSSETWVEAQKALSSLDILREPVSRSLADLDALQIAAAESGISAQAEGALTAALNEVSAIDAEQNQAIASLMGRLANP